MIQINLELAKRLIGDKSLSNSAFRVLLYLMSNPKPTNPKELSAVLCISQKAVCKSIKKLADAGIIQKGELGGRQRMFNVPGHEPSEPNKEPEPDTGGHDERLSRIESLMETMLSDIACLKEAKAIPEMVQSEPEITHTTPILPQTLPISAPLTEPSYNSLAALASLKESLSLQPCEEFLALFAVQVPIGADLLAVNEMCRRKKSGKLDHIKAPLAYLDSISGKVGPPITTPTAPAPKHGTPIVELDIEQKRKAVDLWFALPEEKRRDRIQQKQETTQPGRFKVPYELLARNDFIAEQLAKRT